MQILATTHGTVDQVDSICGPEKKLEIFAKAQTQSTSPILAAVSVRWNRSLLLRKSVGAGIWNITQTLVSDWQAKTPIHGCVLLVGVKGEYVLLWQAALVYLVCRTF